MITKTISHTSGIFSFSHNAEKDFHARFYADAEFTLASNFIRMHIEAKDQVIIGNYQEYLKQNSPTHLDAFTDTQTHEVYFPILTAPNNGSIYTQRYILSTLVHESVHALSQNYSDIFLATTLGRWFEYLNFNYDFPMGNLSVLTGAGKTSVLNQKIPQKAIDLFNKIHNSNPKNKAIIEKKYGYILGNFIFEVMQAQQHYGTTIEQIKHFYQQLYAGISLPDAFSNLTE